MRLTFLWAFACVAIGLLVSVQSVAAQHPGASQINSLGRWLGYGWSRGYHTHDGCQSSCNSSSYSPAITYSSMPHYDSHVPIQAPAMSYPTLAPVQTQQPTPAEKPTMAPESSEKEMPSILPMPKNSAYFRSPARNYPNVPTQNASRAWRGYPSY